MRVRVRVRVREQMRRRRRMVRRLRRQMRSQLPAQQHASSPASSPVQRPRSALQRRHMPSTGQESSLMEAPQEVVSAKVAPVVRCLQMP